jgi:hypothetical protein
MGETPAHQDPQALHRNVLVVWMGCVLVLAVYFLIGLIGVAP